MKFSNLIAISLGFVFTFSNQLCWAQQDLVERNFTGVSVLQDPQLAKKEIMENGAMQVSTDLVRELIGNEKFNKSKSLIEAKVLKINSKFIPYTKTSDLAQEAEQFKMTVTYKISLSDLRSVLKASGVLNESEASPVILPLIKLEDHITGKSYSWWTQDSAMPEVMGKLEKSLKQNLTKNGFHLISTSDGSMLQVIPEEYRGDTLSMDAQAQLFEFLKVNFVLEGTVALEALDQGAYRIEVKLQVLQVGSRKVIADLIRKFDTSSGVFERVVEKKWKESVDGISSDLTLQIADAWQRGSLGSNLVILENKGYLTLPEQERVKERFKAQLPQIKNIRERKLSSLSSIFEIETSFQVPELVSKIPNLDFAGKHMTVQSSSSDLIVVELK